MVEFLPAAGIKARPVLMCFVCFGKSYHRMKTQYDYNLSRIYELVFNSDPCYAFLLEGNSLVQNRLVAAHVFAHSDFFKNNARFQGTSRRKGEIMEAHARRIREYEFKYGRKEVETFLDAVLAVQEHIDPFHREQATRDREMPLFAEPALTPYDDLWALGNKGQPQPAREGKAPEKPRKDLLLFLMRHSKDLEDWQRDLIGIVRDEMAYFWPQLETKIMNEGWATYWHLRLVREVDLPEKEAIEFAKMHAAVLHRSRMHLNPYLVGLKIFEDIERRWDNPSQEERERCGRLGGEGLAKILEVRATETDASFLRNYLTEQLVEDLDLYLYEKVGHDWVITEKDWRKVRDGMVQSLTNCGFPYILVEDGDYQHQGELYLRHCYEGVELDLPYLERTLPHLYLLWGHPVHLETVVDGKEVLFSYDGKRNSRRSLSKPG